MTLKEGGLRPPGLRNFSVANPIPDSGDLQFLYPYNEGSGSTVSDREGNEPDGSVSGATWQSGDGRGGYYLDFDGTDDTLSWSNIDHRGTDGGTLSTWVYPRTDAADKWVWGKADFTNDERNWYFRTDGGGNGEWQWSTWEDGTDTNTENQVTGGTVSLNTWQMLTLVVDIPNSEMRGYVDGQQVGSTSVAGWENTSTTVSYGYLADGDQNHMDMRGDAPLGYQKPLTDSQVAELYDATKGDYS